LTDERAANVEGAARALRAEAAAREVIPALTDADVPTIVLKGPVLVEWLYEGRHERRSYGDLDLLVPPEREAVAGTVLERLGYVPGTAGWTSISQAWRRPKEPFAIDLHRSIVGADAPAEIVWRELSSAAVSRELLGLDLTTLGEPGLALHAALHAAQHGFESGAKPLEDLRRALEAAGQDVWEQAAELARRIDAEPALAAGLRMLPAGAELARRLELTEQLPVDVALRAEPGAPPLVLGLEQLRRTAGLRAKLAFALAKLHPPRSQMLATSALARRSGAGLLLAWAIRPFAVVARLPLALVRHRRRSRTPG
jgi:hypothetical protein